MPSGMKARASASWPPTSTAVTACIAAILTAPTAPDVYRATKYLTPDFVVKVTARRFGKKRELVTTQSLDLVVTLGRPNFRERAFVKGVLRAGEPFPVRKVQLQRSLKR